ncbi:MAG: ABC transporter permease [Lachnospiraceae bacterium]|nr:ABC transporter permease [Lachnospiraceae bacterium]
MSKKQLGGRLLQIVIVLVGISFLTFALTYLAPGDPVRSMYAVNGTIPSEAVLEATREEMGLNDPLLVQYWNWLTGCLHGDFGTSYSLKTPVLTLLSSRLLPTLKLALLSLAMMLVIAVPLGMISAVYKGSVFDYIVRGYTFLGVSMPNFWVGLLLAYYIGMVLGWLPVISIGTGIKPMILPALTLAFPMSSKYARQVRTAVLEELNQDYVTGARARGIKESKILWMHVFPNSLLPLITMLGLSLGSLLGGTAVVEVIFSYPGLGSLAVSAISSMDYPLIQGYVLWIALIYMVVNLVVDLSYNLVDPRMRNNMAAPRSSKKETGKIKANVNQMAAASGTSGSQKG